MAVTEALQPDAAQRFHSPNISDITGVINQDVAVIMSYEIGMGIHTGKRVFPCGLPQVVIALVHETSLIDRPV